MLNADPDGNGIEEKPMLSSFPGQIADPIFTGDVYYNYFRDYHAVTARYLQSDPIGLAGGMNPYPYANNNPVKFVDPTGLVGWKGTLTGASFAAITGAGVYKISLESECVGSRKALVDLIATGPAFGLGALPEISHSEIKVNDNYSDLRPNNLNGGFGLFTAGYAFVIGYGVYGISIGDDGFTGKPVQGQSPKGAVGTGSGFITGYGAGVTSLRGTSTVIGTRYVCCTN